jgi:hypothetical protein
VASDVANSPRPQALLGFEYAFKHLDSRVVVVRSPAGHVVAPEEVMIVEGDHRLHEFGCARWLGFTVQVLWPRTSRGCCVCFNASSGEGMPMFKNPMAKGDLYLKLNIQMPKPEELKNEKVGIRHDCSAFATIVAFARLPVDVPVAFHAGVKLWIAERMCTLQLRTALKAALPAPPKLPADVPSSAEVRHRRSLQLSRV